MKRFLIAFIAVLAVFTVCQTNKASGLANGTVKFIIPQKNYGIIAEFENNRIKETGKINIPYTSKSVFLENRLIVSLCPDGLRIFDEYGKQLLSKDFPQKFTSINCKGNVVYLGGQYDNKNNELAAYFDLTNINFNMNDINIPISPAEGKSIDDILIRNNALFLVDNIIFPKYLFEYDIGIPNNPTYRRTVELKNNGTYEHIIKGDINNNWIILLSSSAGMSGSYRHISIIGKNGEWNESLFFSLQSEKNTELIIQQTRSRWIEISIPILDIGVINNNLLILSEDGLYSIDLTRNITNENITKIRDNKNKYEKLLKINNQFFILLNEEKYELLL